MTINTPITPDTAAASARQLLSGLLLFGESQTLEFKSSFDKATVETLVAFANAQGGTVLIGVTDSGNVQGITLDKERLNECLVHIKAATSPSIIPDLKPHQIGGKAVVTVDVAEFPVKPVSTKGRYYKRVANTNQALNASQIADLYMQTLQLSWDAYPAPHAKVDDLSPAKIERFVSQVNASGRFALDTATPMQALEKLNYIQQGQPTWAAMLLFAQEPLRHHIHIGRFKTPDLIIDDRQITDTLFEAVDQAMKFIVSYVAVAFEFDGSIQRKERYAYLLPALREALLNAVVHRDYTDGSDIQVKIFDKQITIFSPGTFFGKLTVADVQADSYQSSLRNKLVAKGFYLVNAIEKYGSGFIRIRKALLDYPEVEFTVEEKFGGVVATFTQLKSQTSTAGEGVNGGVNTPEDLLAIIRVRPGLKAAELVTLSGKPQRTIERWLKQLKADGQIQFTGAPKTGGYFLTEQKK
ncbi:MAG: putative DNA binding domain-containing protein [Rhodoferax sp.]|uniref:RNA-binding domain-containing protein n=1 Tax=Rhodoferax sp. TaxID=50421 RepID=UPI002ACD25C6|nr:RNA-binding domain-containing protein [Rhodoferax sp.]MDZ7892205.1 putative DNA binding domain-containing protein [Rhodoferax sp.]